MRVLGNSYEDQETGLYYNWHRYYSPKEGRFITSDPIGLAGGLNTYGYGNQNPLRYIDPDGLDWRESVERWWDRSINAARAESPASAVMRVLQALPADAALLGALGTIGRLGKVEQCIANSSVASGLTNLPFRSGEVILREFQTSQGVLDVAAEAQIVGKTLHLKDIAVFPRGAETLAIGTREAVAIRNQLAKEARALGFDQLRITGTRISGANPGKAVDVTINLMGR